MYDDIIPNKEQMVRAELHLLQKKSPTPDSHYNGNIHYRMDKSHKSLPKLTFERISSTPGWKTFDITPMVAKWEEGMVNQGIQLTITKGKETLSCEGVFSEAEQDPVDDEPLLIVFTKSHDSNNISEEVIATHQQQETKRSSTQNDECSRKKMVITADTLTNTLVKVLLPKSFDAGVCEGQCTPPPTTSSLQHVTHAHFVYSHYYNTGESSGIPSRCCVPTSYKKITMLFYIYNVADKASSLVIKQVPAIAASCTCL